MTVEVLQSDLGPKLVYLLGISNLLGLLLVFFSCRCLMGPGLGKLMTRIPNYMKFYSLHCYFWWFFFISVALHAVLAILIYGNPFVQ